jgi:integrase
MDLKHMKLPRGPGSVWFFVINIPKDLRGHARFTTSRGKQMSKVTESLKTTDADLARERRDARLAYWARQFRMMRDGPSEADVREEAVEVFRRSQQAAAERRKTEVPRPAAPDPEWEAILAEVDAEVGAYCKRLGITLTPDTDAHRRVTAEFLIANVRGRTWLGDAPASPPATPATSHPDYRDPDLPAKTAETFSQAFDRYLATELDGTSARTIADYRDRVRVFTDKLGDLPLSKVTDHAAVQFLDDYLLGERKVSARTRNQYAMLFSAIFKCAVRRKKISTNPFDDQRIKAATVHYEPFSDEELVTLFADMKFEITPAKHTTAAAAPWASLIAAYSGGRLEEVAQLRAADIKQTDGIWHFDLCAGGNGKTKAATRSVPLHHALIDAGLLKYRDALPKDGLLFPGLRARGSKDGRLGPRLGDWFGWWRKKVGIDRVGLNFHSFRHTVGDRLRKAGVQESDIAAVLGHEDERITSRVYGHGGPGLRRLKEIVEKIVITNCNIDGRGTSRSRDA